MKYDALTSGWHVRPATKDDLKGLVTLAETADDGMTNLPPDLSALGERVEKSLQSFSRDIGEPVDELYLLVLDDGSGAIAGTACVFSKVGQGLPFYTYRRTKLVHHSRELGKSYTEDILQLSNDFGGATEVGGLFLHPRCRTRGAGRLLARSRYMLIGRAQHRFSSRVIAELRGWVAPDGATPFWDSLGKKFFHMSLAEADRYGGINGNQFIADLMPKYPIYTSMLPPAVRALIGKVHESSAPALKLLLNEGFDLTDHVDIFDAGPVVQCATSNLKAITDQISGKVVNLRVGEEGYTALLSKGYGHDFCCWTGEVSAGYPGYVLCDDTHLAETGEEISSVVF